MKAYTPLVILWIATTIPVLAVGAYLFKNLHEVHTVTQTKMVVVTPTVVPTATPSATPSFQYRLAPTTVKGGVK